MYKFLLITCLGFISLVTSAQEIDLQQQLSVLAENFNGDVGIYFKHLVSGEEVEINADTIFPTASIIKVPILVGMMDKIHRGELDYHQELIYRDSLKYGGSGLMQFFRDSTVTEVGVLLSLMISHSDNTTSLWCQSLAGGGQQINQLMEKYGLRHTRVNSRTPGREKDWEKYGWGQTTPREMAHLLVKIRAGEVISEQASERMYRLLGNIYYDENALSAIPPYIQTASKQGMVNASRSELLMVNAPGGDYVLYIATKNNKDQRWEDDNEASVLQREVSRVVWEYTQRNK
jgi:beta-lactamase class A